MADRQAVDPFALTPGWVFQILLWSLGASALFLSRAIDLGESPLLARMRRFFWPLASEVWEAS